MWVFTTKVLVHLFSEIGMKLLTLLPENSNKEKKKQSWGCISLVEQFPIMHKRLAWASLSAKMMMFMIRLIVIIIKIN